MGWRRRRGDDSERTESGQPILRHAARDRPFEAANHGDARTREAIEAHLERHLSPCDSVLHEIVSDLVHLDVFMWRPTADRSFYTFVTVGMSDRPMTVPPDAIAAGCAQRAELVLCLPADWPVPSGEGSVSPWNDEEAYFPIRWLKQLARLPHEYDTWFGSGHSIPNGDPPQPLATATRLCGWVLLPPRTLPPSFRTLALPGKDVEFLGIVAVHRDEMDRKLARGVEGLLDGFDAYGVSELLDVSRPSSL